jgi:hypothetical protein
VPGRDDGENCQGWEGRIEREKREREEERPSEEESIQV